MTAGKWIALRIEHIMLRFMVRRLRRNEDALRSKNAFCPAPVNVHRSRAESDRHLFCGEKRMYIFPAVNRSAVDPLQMPSVFPG